MDGRRGGFQTPSYLYAYAQPRSPRPLRRKSGLPDLRTIMRNPGKPGFQGGFETRAYINPDPYAT